MTDNQRSNEVTIYLNINSFEYSPSEITKRLDIEPTKINIKGNEYISFNGKMKIAMDNEWELKKKMISNDLLEEIFNLFITEIIIPRIYALKEIARDAKIDISIQQFYFQGNNPGFHIDPKNISILNEIESTLDLDLYCLNQDDD